MLLRKQFQMNKIRAHMYVYKENIEQLKRTYTKMKQLIYRCSITKVARYNVMVVLLMVPCYLVFLL